MVIPKNHTNSIIGILLISGAIGLLIPYSILIITFDYPDILRQDTASILTKFHKGGSTLILTWFAFAVTGIPLIPAYILIGQHLDKQNVMIRTATTLGVVGLIVQMIGLLRWTFVVPVLAETFVTATDEPTRTVTIISFKVIHQFGGVLLGEHIGQLFTIAWTLMISVALRHIKAFPKWLSLLGYVASGIYLSAHAELFATVIPGFPFWEMAGFLGSTLWLIWLTILGLCYIKFGMNGLSKKPTYP